MRMLIDDFETQENFKRNVKRIIKKDMGVTYTWFCNKINFPEHLFRTKMCHYHNKRFNITEMLIIAHALDEYLEDLCKGEK